MPEPSPENIEKMVFIFQDFTESSIIKLSWDKKKVFDRGVFENGNSRVEFLLRRWAKKWVGTLQKNSGWEDLPWTMSVGA